MCKMNGCTSIVNCDDIRYVPHANNLGWDIYVKMELLTPLMKALPAEVQEETVLCLAQDMCSALVLCSKYGIIHRDIKPQNMFVSSNGDFKLGDFSIAKAVEKTMGGTKIGTYKYMAPEVYHCQPYSSSVDIYSLGLVLYWLLNGRRMPCLPQPPAKVTTEMENQARNRRLAGETLPPPVNGSEELKAIVLKACAYNPEDRYHSAEEMLAALNALNGYNTSVDVVIDSGESDPGREVDSGSDVVSDSDSDLDSDSDSSSDFHSDSDAGCEDDDPYDKTVYIFSGDKIPGVGSAADVDVGKAIKAETEVTKTTDAGTGKATDVGTGTSGTETGKSTDVKTAVTTATGTKTKETGTLVEPRVPGWQGLRTLELAVAICDQIAENNKKFGF